MTLRLSDLPAKQQDIARRQMLGQPSAEEERSAHIGETAEQKEIVKLFVEAGFQIRSTSQYRKAKISPGIPDLIFTHRTMPLMGFWESKRQVGAVTSEFQEDFAADCRRCGVLHGAGDRYHARQFIVRIVGGIE